MVRLIPSCNEAHLDSNHSAYRIFLRIADFDPENVVQQPVDGLLLVEHEYELNN